MKIALIFHFTPDSDRAIDHFLYELSKRLIKSNCQLIHFYTGEPSLAFKQKLSELDIPFFVSPPVRTISDGFMLAKEVRRFGADIMFTGFYSPFIPGIIALKLFSGCKIWIDNDHSSGANIKGGMLKEGLKKYRSKVIGSMIDRVICVSNFVKRRQTQMYFPEMKSTTIYNGIDVKKFMVQKQANNPNLHIVYVGQLIKEKGVYQLIDACKSLNVDYQLSIAGKGPDEIQLQSYAAEKKVNVNWLGYITDVPKLFSTADIAVFPSVWEEAFGLVIAEAMAVGTAVVASNTGGIPEVVGKAGLLFDPNDVNALSKCINKLAVDNSLRKKLEATSRTRVTEYFSLDYMVAEYSKEILAFNTLKYG